MAERAVRSTLTAAVAGSLAWTAAEYGLHRFVMHEMRGRGLPSVEHLRHHADVTYFSPASKKAVSALATGLVAFPLAAAIAGRRRAAAFTLGLTTTYLGYEVAHRRTHTHPPRTAYGRWARRNHLQHHFGAPMRNFGVTTPWWDRVFGTDELPGLVAVPARMAPEWLVDDRGAVRLEFAADYAVRSGRRADDAQVESDRLAAFANEVPDL